MTTPRTSVQSGVSTKDNVVPVSITSMEPLTKYGTGADNAAYLDDKLSDYQIGVTNGHPLADVIANGDTEGTKQNGAVSSPKMVAGPSDSGSKLYVRRWSVLVLFCLYSFSNAFQWIHLNIIANVVGEFYKESLPSDSYQRNTAIDWLSLLYMIVYIPFIFPATWLLDKKGLRLSCIVGSCLNAVGAWLKCASVSPERFGLLMFAQTICSIAQLWVLNIPPRLAAVWFGVNEVSTATSIGVFGNQLGVAAGFVLPPIIVPVSNNTDVLSRNLYAMAYGNAGFATACFVLILAFLPDKPALPPSIAQLCALKAATNENYKKSLLNLFKNVSFVILVISYGINTGSYYAISTLLSYIVLAYFPGQDDTAGWVGLTIILAGILASVLAGIWLDKTKTFKGTTVAIYVLTIASTVAFTFTLDLKKVWVVFLTAGLLGFFMTGYLPVGFEFAAEITFPESEGTSCGLLNTSATIFGIILTIGMRYMLDSISVLSANITICAFLLVGGIITVIIKPDYRRQAAGKVIVEEIANQQLDVATIGTENQNYTFAPEIPKGTYA